MTKGEDTHDRIIASAAPLFNTLGYAGTSMADLMAASGLEKGGLYRHFGSKDDLALAAFDHSWRLTRARLQSYVNEAPTSAGRLIAVADGMASIAEDPPVAGGCPLLNTATESDHAEGPLFDALRERSRRSFRALINFTRKLIETGVASGELRPEVDPEAEANVIMATLEGGVMLSMLYADDSYARQAAEHVATHVMRMSSRA